MQRLDKIRTHQAGEGKVAASGSLSSLHGNSPLNMCEDRCLFFICIVHTNIMWTVLWGHSVHSFLNTTLLEAAFARCSFVQNKRKNTPSRIFKSEVLIKLVSSVRFHMVLRSFLLHSNPQKQNTSAFIKAIHTLFSGYFPWASCQSLQLGE